MVSCICCNARNAPARTAGVPVRTALNAASDAFNDTSAFTARCATAASGLAVSGRICAAAPRARNRTSAAMAAVCTEALVSDRLATNSAGVIAAFCRVSSTSARSASAFMAGSLAAATMVACARAPTNCRNVNIAATRA